VTGRRSTVANTRVVLRGDGTGSVVVDGHDLSAAVQTVDVHMTAGRKPRVTVGVVGLTTSVLVVPEDGQLVLPDDVHEALVALGWNPPADPDTAVPDDEEASEMGLQPSAHPDVTSAPRRAGWRDQGPTRDEAIAYTRTAVEEKRAVVLLAIAVKLADELEALLGDDQEQGGEDVDPAASTDTGGAS
jgi:hypothetical protein